MTTATGWRWAALASTVCGAAVLAAAVSPAMAADVTKQRLENADNEPQNWLTGFVNYMGHRYSKLNQVTRDNVKNLKVAWTIPIPTAFSGRTNVQLENYTLVDDGQMYFDDAAGTVYKVDARGNAGKIVWKTDLNLSKDEQGRSRGGAFWANNYYANLTDGRVIALNRDTGEIVWDKQIARVPHPKGANVNVQVEGFTAAPLAIDGRIVVANSKGDSGTNGWVSALNATNGQEMWRTYSVPGPGEPGHETWKDDHGAWKTGGAAFWTTGNYDVAQKVTIWGAAQPVPMFDPEFRPGDNLYSNSALAFDIDTGKIKWYFQYTPNESWDYDENGAHVLVDAPFGGSDKKMVVHFARNGFYYQLDRTNGAFLSADKWVEKITWTAGIDPKTGKPMEYNPSLALQTYIPATRWARADTDVKQACPALEGGARWQPPAYNPTKRLVYQGGEDGCQTKAIVAVVSVAGGGNIEPDAKKNPGGRTGQKPNSGTTQNLHGQLVSADVTTGKIKAKLQFPYSNRSGVLATAGGLVFTANVDGGVTAHNDDTLQQLWRFDTGIVIKAAPVTYSVNNKQYISILAGAPGLGSSWPELEWMVPGAMLYVFTL